MPTLVAPPANYRHSGVSLRLPLAKVRTGNADLESAHGHSGLCWAALRAADPKLVVRPPALPVARSPLHSGGSCQHPWWMSVSECTEAEQRMVPSPETGESNSSP